MSDADHRLSLSNPGPEKLVVWLEPWAEEVEVPARSTVTMEGLGGLADGAVGELEWFPDHLTLWGKTSKMKVYINDVLQDTTSAVVPMPIKLTKAMLTTVFGGQPKARLGGAFGDAEDWRTLWSRLKRRFRFSQS